MSHQALDHLPYDERANFSILSAAERSAVLDGADPAPRSPRSSAALTSTSSLLARQAAATRSKPTSSRSVCATHWPGPAWRIRRCGCGW